MHSHDRTLLSKLGFSDPDKKNPLHDLACQYLALPENHLRLAKRAVDQSCAAKGSMPMRIDTPLGNESQTYLQWTFSRAGEAIRTVKPSLEYPLSKGDGRFKTTIGFLDVVLPYEFVEVQSGLIEDWVPSYIELEMNNVYTHRGTMGITQRDLPEELRDRFPCRGADCKVIRVIKPDDHLAKIPKNGRSVVAIPQYNRAAKNMVLREERHRRLAVEVKIERVSLGDALRQINLYKEYLEDPYGSAHWVLATVYPLSTEDTATLRAEGIDTIRLGPGFEAYAQQRKQAQNMTPSDTPEF